MVQFYNPQALQNPGLGVAAQLLGDMRSQQLAKEKNKNDILQVLLGQGSLAMREKAHDLRERETGLGVENLKAQRNLGAITSLQQALGILPVDGQASGLEMETMTKVPESFAEQSGVLKQGDSMPAIPPVVSEKDGLQEQGLIPMPSTQPKTIQAGITAKDNRSTVDPKTAALIQAMIMSNNPETALNMADSTGRTVLGQKHIAELDKILREEGEARTTAPARLGKTFVDYGKAQKDLEEKNIKVPSPAYLAGEEGLTGERSQTLKRIPRLKAERMIFARKTPADQAAVADAANETYRFIDQFGTMKAVMDKYRGPQYKNMWNNIGNVWKTSPIGQVMLGEDVPPDLLAVLDFYQAQQLAAFQLAKAAAGPGQLSNQETARALTAMGDPRLSRTVFDKTFESVLKRSFESGFKGAALSNEVLYDDFNEKFKERFGHYYDNSNPNFQEQAVKSNWRTMPTKGKNNLSLNGADVIRNKRIEELKKKGVL